MEFMPTVDGVGTKHSWQIQSQLRCRLLRMPHTYFLFFQATCEGVVPKASEFGRAVEVAHYDILWSHDFIGIFQAL
jgi:hypothetical protein